MEWTEKQLEEFWEKKPLEERIKLGGFVKWKKTIIPEID